jgi:sugar/nucleoside kinase (ribokinase family)
VLFCFWKGFSTRAWQHHRECKFFLRQDLGEILSGLSVGRDAVFNIPTWSSCVPNQESAGRHGSTTTICISCLGAPTPCYLVTKVSSHTRGRQLTRLCCSRAGAGRKIFVFCIMQFVSWQIFTHTLRRWVPLISKTLPSYVSKCRQPPAI